MSYKYALISVFDKKGIVEFGQQLHKLGYRIISTEGTAKTLKAAAIPVIPVEQITKNPESFDGRMKTVSFQIESGILFDRQKSSHVKQAKDLGIIPIDIVVCNLYPFEQAVSKNKVNLETSLDNIDVGGPTMVRAAAKNFTNVLVVVDPKDYVFVAEALTNKKATAELRQKLAAKAFYHLSFYDSQIANFLGDEFFPDEFVVGGKKGINLRYGENPHQQAAVYFEPNSNSPLTTIQKISGRDLSYLNFTDISAGLDAVRLFTQPAAVVIKHNTPCGIALGKNSSQALERAIEADPVSAFGGVIVLNSLLDFDTAKIIASFKENRRGNIDIVAAPDIQQEAADMLKSIRKSMGIYQFGKIPKTLSKRHIKYFDGGFILQTTDKNIDKYFTLWKIVTKIKPSSKQLEQMKIGWKFVSRIRSNAVIIVDKALPMTRGIGSGQTSRINSTKIALEQAGKYVQGAILVSDSFFPFSDSIELAAKYKVGAILQQGGSVRDKDSIEAANKAGIAMVFTNTRAFWH